MIARYLTAEIYKPHYGDCSNGGISSRFHEVKLICEDGPGTFDTLTECPLNLCIMQKETFGFAPEGVLKIYPAAVDEFGNIVKRPGWWMNGGCVVGDSDSRFGRKASSLLGRYFSGAINLHDRQE